MAYGITGDDLGVKLQEARIKAGLSVSRVAKILNTSESVINKLEKNPYRVPLHWVERYCKVVGASVELRVWY